MKSSSCCNCTDSVRSVVVWSGWAADNRKVRGVRVCVYKQLAVLLADFVALNTAVAVPSEQFAEP